MLQLTISAALEIKPDTLVILDLRGRPLDLPSQVERRMERMARWAETLGI